MTALKSILNKLVAHWAVFLAAASAVILGAALFFQYVLDHQPCELCLYQRYPYVLVIAVGVIAYIVRHQNDIAWKRAARGFLVVMTALLILDAGIAFHHIGVERDWWDAYTSCVGPQFEPGATSEELLRFLQDAQVVPCDQRRTFLGISFAEYNFVMATLLAAFGIYTMRKTR